MNRRFLSYCITEIVFFFSIVLIFTSCIDDTHNDHNDTTHNTNNNNSGNKNPLLNNNYDKDLNPEGKIPFSDDKGVFLGLSVNWAEFNLGAENKDDIGGYYGWGDITGSYYSSDLSYYPSSDPPMNISGTPYDIVTKQWGEGWRMPTKEEVEELLENCFVDLADNGWTIHSLGYTQNTLSIPVTNIRIEKELNNVTAYWTANLNTDNTDKAYSFSPGRDSETMFSIFPRSYGLPIRPVKDIVYDFDPTNLSYFIDGEEYKMIYVEGNDEIESFYIMQTEIPRDSYFQIGDFVGTLDANLDGVVSRNEYLNFSWELNSKTQLPFRFPTTKEWLYAAKGGKLSKNYKYSGSNSIDEVAWYNSNSGSKAHKIAQKKPNELGLYDMSGNYEELCVEIIRDKKYTYLTSVDNKTYGGSWKDAASKCTRTSWKEAKGSNDLTITSDKGLNLSEKNAFDGRFITIRLVYNLR